MAGDIQTTFQDNGILLNNPKGDGRVCKKRIIDSKLNNLVITCRSFPLSEEGLVYVCSEDILHVNAECFPYVTEGCTQTGVDVTINPLPDLLVLRC